MDKTRKVKDLLNDEEFNDEHTITIRDDADLKQVNLLKICYYFMQGYDVVDVANMMDISRPAVRNIMNSPAFKEVMSSITLEVSSIARMFLSASGIQAVRTLIDCMNSPNDSVRLKAATEILDRIGLKEPTKIEVLAEGSAFSHMTDTQMLEVLKFGMEELMPPKKEDDK